MAISSAHPGQLSVARATTGDRIRSIAVLVTAVAQVASAPLTPLVLGPGAETGPISDSLRSAATPAGYAFSIWGLIYLACLVLAAYQLPARRITEPANRASGWWLVLGFASSAIWIPVFGVRLIWLSQIIIVTLAVALAVALSRLTRLGPAATQGERWCLRIPIGIYLGWAVCATFAGFGLTARSFGLPADGPSQTFVAVALVVLATVACVVIVLRLQALAGFAFTSGWALTAIAIGTYEPAVRIVALVGLASVIGVLVVRTAQSTRKDVILLG